MAAVPPATGISSSSMPSAIFAVTRAMGYPLALLASAEERETRGLTSMRKYSLDSGFSANWTLQPPSIFSSRMILIALSFSIFRSWSFSERIGATTMLSPVWTPTGSTFSMPQIVMAWSALSRMTSNSISL